MEEDSYEEKGEEEEEAPAGVFSDTLNGISKGKESEKEEEEAPAGVFSEEGKIIEEKDESIPEVISGVQEGAEPLAEEYQEPLEEIIEETPVSNYPRFSSANRGVSPVLQASDISQTSVNTIQDSQSSSASTESQTINEPQYASASYEQRETSGEETGAGYPETIMSNMAGQGGRFSPSLPSNFSPSIQQRTQFNNLVAQDDSLQQIRRDDEKYKSSFEQQSRDKRRL